MTNLTIASHQIRPFEVNMKLTIKPSDWETVQADLILILHA